MERGCLLTGNGADQPQKKISLEMTYFCEFLVVFYSMISPENVEFSALSCDLVHAEGVLLGICEYAASVRVMGLVIFYCIVIQAILCLKFCNMTKSGWKFALASQFEILGYSFPTPLFKPKRNTYLYQL